MEADFQQRAYNLQESCEIISRAANPPRGRKFKVLQILPSQDFGGAERMVLTLLDAMDQESFASAVCVIGAGPMLGALAERGVPVRQLRPYRGKRDLAFLWRLLGVMRDLRPDVVHAHIWFASFYASLCGRALRIPVVATFHSNYAVESRLERMMLKLIHSCCDQLIFVSNHQLGHFSLPRASHKIKIVPNGINLPDLGNSPAPAMAESKRLDLGLTPADPVIICVGNLRPVKGHSFLLSAFRLLQQTQPGAKLVVVGEGPLLADLQAQCRLGGLEGSVHFLGARDDVLDLLAMSDVFVSSSSSEAWSMAIMEAMAVGKPVVATKVGGNPELIGHGTDGLLVPFGDASEMAGALAHLLSDRAYAQQLGNSAMRKARARFGGRRMADCYGQIYRSVVNLPRWKPTDQPITLHLT